MPITDNGISVSYAEMSDPQKSPVERVDDQGVSATVLYECAWADRLTLAFQLLTRYRVSRGGMVFTVGDRLYSNVSSYAKRVGTIEPFGPRGVSSGRMVWEQARMAVEYEPLAFDPMGEGESSEADPADTAIVYNETYSPTAEFTTLPNKKLSWDDADTDLIKDAEAPGHLVRMSEWNLQFRAVGPLHSSIDSFKGMVNNSAVTSRTLGITFDAETLLYHGPQIEHQRMSDGSDLYDVTMRFTHRPGGWNKFIKSADASTAAIYTVGGGVFKPFTLAGFSGLYP